MTVNQANEPILEVKGLTVEFQTAKAPLTAVDDVSWSLNAGETLAILGESGSGKSVSTQAIVGILDMPPGRIVSGTASYRGQDLLAMPRKARRKIVGDRITMVFQDSLSALNPVQSVGAQIAESYRVHRGLGRREARERAIDMLAKVRIPAPRQRVHDYPHQFSGGMRQRVMLAMALALDPDVLIADEPTTALDVTVQAQILELLAELQAETTMAVVLITHDLRVVEDVADQVVVMYAGRVVEQGRRDRVLTSPAHPYTEGLLKSMPAAELKGSQLATIPGTPPSLSSIPSGCAFRTRCGYAFQECAVTKPELLTIADGRGGARSAACLLDLDRRVRAGTPSPEVDAVHA